MAGVRFSISLYSTVSRPALGSIQWERGVKRPRREADLAASSRIRELYFHCPTRVPGVVLIKHGDNLTSAVGCESDLIGLRTGCQLAAGAAGSEAGPHTSMWEPVEAAVRPGSPPGRLLVRVIWAVLSCTVASICCRGEEWEANYLHPPYAFMPLCLINHRDFMNTCFTAHLNVSFQQFMRPVEHPVEEIISDK
jgi:hypothetical protein